MNKVQVYIRNKFLKEILMTNAQIQDRADRGIEIYLSNGSFREDLYPIEETVYEKSEILNDPFLNL